MAWRSSGRTNQELIANLSKNNIIKSQVVKSALLSIDRKYYSPTDPYEDAPQSIDYGATISAPHMHAMCLEEIKNFLKPGMKALDVGSGSGYLVAAMSKMVGNSGFVVGIDHIPELVKLAKQNISKGNPEIQDHISIVLGDGRLGYVKEAPYDAIHVGAAAWPIPEKLLEQLNSPGVMVVPIGLAMGAQELVKISKDSDGKITQESICGVRYVPLTSKEVQLNL